MKLSSCFLDAISTPTVLTSSTLILLYSLPVLLLLMVYPIEVAALYTFLTAALVLYILIVFYVEYKSVLDVDFGLMLLVYYIAPHITIVFIFTIFFVFC